jgi:hypothetical protein
MYRSMLLAVTGDSVVVFSETSWPFPPTAPGTQRLSGRMPFVSWQNQHEPIQSRQTDQTESMLLTEIAPSLPNIQTLVLPQPHGSVQMVVFAGDAQGFR